MLAVGLVLLKLSHLSAVKANNRALVREKGQCIIASGIGTVQKVCVCVGGLKLIIHKCVWYRYSFCIRSTKEILLFK